MIKPYTGHCNCYCFGFCKQLLLLKISFLLLTSTAWSQGALVEPQWLNKQLSDASDWVVLDVRPERDYRQNHIQGAINIPVEKTYRQVGKAKKVATVSTIQTLFGKSGISNDSSIVLYDEGNYLGAARMYWVFEIYGHQKVMMLNGGFSGWRKNNLPISEETRSLRPTRYIAAIQPDRLATKFQTRLAVEDINRYIIDARPNDEYIGRVSEANRLGHIPSAISIPWDKNFSEVDGVMVIKKFSELKKEYRSIDEDKQVITYCNGGKQSSLTYFVLRQLGFDVAHYDGSWLEWANDPNLPIINKAQ